MELAPDALDQNNYEDAICALAEDHASRKIYGTRSGTIPAHVADVAERFGKDEKTATADYEMIAARDFAIG